MRLHIWISTRAVFYCATFVAKNTFHPDKHHPDKHQKQLKGKLNSMNKSDRNFWQRTKEIAGLDVQRGGATPDVDDIVDHFAEKMSNGKGEEECNFKLADSFTVPISGFKIRFKTVLKSLKAVDPTKSANGISPKFWKECAVQRAPIVCKLFKYIVKVGKYPSRWKFGRITALHKRGSVKLPKNYRPVQVLMGISVIFEGNIEPQFTKWIMHFIPDV